MSRRGNSDLRIILLLQYQRLLFPHQDAYFSDFEALGAQVHFRAVEIESGTILEEFTTSHNSGVEFGYKVKVNKME